MKVLKNFISDNIIPLLEIILMIIIPIIPFIFDVKGMFSSYLANNYPEPDTAIYYFIIEKGNGLIAVALFILTVCFIRKNNSGDEKLLNRLNVYHDYPFLWYWVCAKILGFKKCNLVLVPIFMQFKLITRNTFIDYPLDDLLYPDEENCTIKIDKLNWASNPSEINVILEDTYPIKTNQLPQNKKNLPTIKISRNDGVKFERRFSDDFINSVINEIRKFPSDNTINIFATTNPKNTIHIVKRVFVTGGRGNTKHLFVFQQDSKGNREFKSEGKKIY